MVVRRTRSVRARDRACPPAPRGRNRGSETLFQRAGPSGRSATPIAGAIALRPARSSPVIGAAGIGGEQHVAAGRVEAAGQGIEQRHGARRLGRVGVMLVPAPGVVGDRPRMPDQARRFFELPAGNPAGRLHRFRRVSGGRARRSDRTPAGRPPSLVDGRDAVLAVEGKMLDGRRRSGRSRGRRRPGVRPVASQAT